MQKEFTRQFMIDNRGCYSEEQINSCSFMKEDVIKLKSIVNSEILLRDKFWFVCKKVLTKEQTQQLAISVAEIVLDIYESKYPDNKAPRLAIEAARLYLLGKISLSELKEKRDAAASATYAAYAAVAYAASGEAEAYAIYAAAYAAYYAADSDSAAAAYTYAFAASDYAEKNHIKKLSEYLKQITE